MLRRAIHSNARPHAAAERTIGSSRRPREPDAHPHHADTLTIDPSDSPLEPPARTSFWTDRTTEPDGRTGEPDERTGETDGRVRAARRGEHRRFQPAKALFDTSGRGCRGAAVPGSGDDLRRVGRTKMWCLFRDYHKLVHDRRCFCIDIMDHADIVLPFAGYLTVAGNVPVCQLGSLMKISSPRGSPRGIPIIRMYDQIASPWLVFRVRGGSRAVGTGVAFSRNAARGVRPCGATHAEYWYPRR